MGKHPGTTEDRLFITTSIDSGYHQGTPAEIIALIRTLVGLSNEHKCHRADHSVDNGYRDKKDADVSVPSPQGPNTNCHNH